MKTTAQDFEYFKAVAQEYLQAFGMIGFKWYFVHGGSDNGGVTPNDYIADRVMTIRLAKDIDDTVFNIAKHEACEAFIGRFAQLADRRCTTQEQLDDERHFVVRTLEQLIP